MDGTEPHEEGNGEEPNGHATSKPVDADFVAPETVGDKEDANGETELDEEPAKDRKTAKHKHRGLPKWLQFKQYTKKQWIIFGVVIAVLLIGGGVTTYALTRKSPPPKKPTHHTIVTMKKPTPVPTTVASKLTGLPVAPSINNLPVTAVMIENSTFARPQSGLAEAGVVFEAIAEGGITRFVALYQNNTTPSYIGPVRSVRPYYLSWLDGFDAPVAHVGGSPEALQDLASWGIRNMDQEYNGSYFTRITSREAPHNVYTSMAELSALENSLGYTTSTYTGFLRKAPDPSKDPTATTINFDISYGAYNVQYKYNQADNDYERYEGGAAQMDVNAAGVQTQVAPTVVVAMIMPNYLESDGLHNVYGTVGSGQAYIFQDGTVTVGTWKKPANNAQITFTGPTGKPLALDDGNTWLTALGQANEVTYN